MRRMISTLLLAVSLAPVAARADGMDLGGQLMVGPAGS